ncbi:DUF4435 domain-containing protein [Aeromonas salmonicida]|uniref:DUF4435 domain-containing protein n=1 Tax=Aeromonas salmonicida TaxID=645 RepID=UPI0037F06153
MSVWNKEPGTIISEIKMMYASNHCYFWLVEGPSDSKFFTLRKYDNVELIISGGKRNIIQAIEGLKEDPLYRQTIGIVDHDIDWLLKIARDQNIIVTDPRDIEGILLRSSALDKVLVEYGDASKIKSFEINKGVTVRQFIHDTSSFFGKIRAVNELNNKVCLKKLKPQIFIEKSSWSYDYKAAIDYCVTKLNVSPSDVALITEINRLPAAAPWHYVRGHDALNILVGGLTKELGSSNVDENKIQTALRMGLEVNEYERTSLFRDLSNWHLKQTCKRTAEGESDKSKKFMKAAYQHLKRLRSYFTK